MDSDFYAYGNLTDHDFIYELHDLCKRIVLQETNNLFNIYFLYLCFYLKKM
jgi:hypothetical protein